MRSGQKGSKQPMIPPAPNPLGEIKAAREDAEESYPCTSGYAPGKSTKRFPAKLINRRGRSTVKEPQEVSSLHLLARQGTGEEWMAV
jgi:hypothetical protein